MKKNKLLSLFLVIIMVFSCVNTLPTTVIALGNPTFTVSSGNGNPGEDVTLTVDISNNPGICTATIWVHYDEGLKLKSVTDSCLLVGGLFGGDKNANPYELVEPDYDNDGNIEYWNCNDCGKYFSDADGNDEIVVEDTVIGKIVIKEYRFIDGEVIIEAPSNLMPDGTYFDVQKIVPPPAEIVEKVKEQRGESSEVLAYYDIRLINDKGEYIIYLDDDITIKTKMAMVAFALMMSITNMNTKSTTEH